MSADGINSRFSEEIDGIVRAVWLYRDSINLDELPSDLDAFRRYAKDNPDYIACKERIAAQVIQALREQIRKNVFGERKEGGNYGRSLRLLENGKADIWRLFTYVIFTFASLGFLFTISHPVRFIGLGGAYRFGKEIVITYKRMKEDEEQLLSIISRLIDAAVKARIRELIEQADLQEQAP